jgi:hypothetical protein
MKWNTAIKWIMLVSGLLTFTMVYAAIAPHEALRSSFGESLDGAVADIVVRNWGALIALVGAMLVYGAYAPHVRVLVLSVAAISKVVFIGLVLSYGARFLSYQAGVAVVVDGVMVAVFGLYLAIGRPKLTVPAT